MIDAKRGTFRVQILEYRNAHHVMPRRRRWHWWVLGAIGLFSIAVLYDVWHPFIATRGGARPIAIDLLVTDANDGKPVHDAHIVGATFGHITGSLATTDSSGCASLVIEIMAPRGMGYFHTTTHFTNPRLRVSAAGYVTQDVILSGETITTVFGIGPSAHTSGNVVLQRQPTTNPSSK